MIIEKLEDRRLLSSGPIIVATFPGGIGGRVVVDSAGDIFGTVESSGTDAGSVFEIPAGTNTPKTLASFGPNDGTNTLGIDPSDIVIDSAGNLYGDANLGGPKGMPAYGIFYQSGGTLWELPKGSSSITMLYALGFNGNGGLSRDATGDLFDYGYVAHLGGSLNGSFAFEYTSGGVYKSLGGNASSLVLDSVTNENSDAAGNAYLTVRSGSSPDQGYLQEVPAGQDQNAATTIFNSSDPIDSLPVGVTADSAGNLFVTTKGSAKQQDGSFLDTSGIVEINAGTTSATPLGYLYGTANGSNFIGNPIVDAAGDVFAVTTKGGQYGYGNLVELPAGQSTFQTLISFNTQYGYSQAAGVTVDANGTLYGTLPNGSGTAVYKWAGVGTVATAISGAPTIIATFDGGVGSGVVVDSTGDVFGTIPSSNTSAGSVFEIPAGTNAVQTLASFGPNDSTNTLGINPGDILIDSAGNLYGETQLGGPNGLPDHGLFYPSGGTIWELPKGSHSIQVLAGLNYNSNGDLSRDSAGDFFGLDHYDERGAIGNDYAFESTNAGAFLTFNYVNSNKYDTVKAVTSDAAGNAYILVQSGYSSGTIFIDKVPAGNDGSASTTVFSTGATAVGLSSDPAGNLFVTEDGLISESDGTFLRTCKVVKITAGTGEQTTLGIVVGSTRQTALGNTPSTFSGAPVVDAAGDVFDVTNIGGDYGYGALVEVPAGQNTFKTLLSFNTPGGYIQAAGLTVDANGTLYGTLPNGSGTAVYQWPDVGTSTNSINPTPNPTIGLQPTIIRSKLPVSIVGGVNFKAAVSVRLNTLSQAAAAGVVTTKLYATTNSTDVLLGQISQHYRGGKRALAGTFRVTTSLPAGTYTLIAQTSDSQGNVVTGPTGTSLTIKTPFTHVSAQVTTITPRLHPGATGSIILSLTNTGNIAASDPITISIVDGFTLLAQTLHVIVHNGRRAVRVRLRFAVPTGTAGGLYDPVVTATEDGVATVTNSAKQFLVY